MKKLTSFLFFLVISTIICQAQTTQIIIDNAGTGDYTTVQAALNSINGKTITQPHIFRIKSGTYTEQIILKEVKGTSASNTITIESFDGDSNSVYLHFANATIMRDGASFNIRDVSHVTLRNLNFNGPVTDGIALGLGDNSSYISIYKCNFWQAPSNNKTTYSVAPVYDFMAKNWIINSVTMEECKTTDMTPISDMFILRMTNLTVKKSVFNWRRNGGTNNFYTGDNLLFENNIFNYSAIGSLSGSKMVVRNNLVLTASTCVFVSPNVDSIGNNAEIYNNFFIADRTDYAIILTGKHIKFWHNNLLTLANNSDRNCLFISNLDSSEILNNNFMVKNGRANASALIMDTSISNAYVKMDYNNYYVPNGNISTLITGAGLQYNKTLANHQASLTGKDQKSLNLDPLYFSDGDLHIANASLKKKGTPIAKVTHDYDGNPRDKNNPDIGADEMTSLANLSASSIAIGSGTFEPGRSIEVNYSVTNIGDLALNNFSWIDEIYISRNQILDDNDLAIGQINNNFTVQPNGSYTRKITASIPYLSAGDYYLILKVNTSELGFENNFSDNIVVSTKLTLGQLNFPDLEITEVRVPNEAFSGKTFKLEWTVKNKGNNATNGNWTDHIYVASDSTLLSNVSNLRNDSLLLTKRANLITLQPNETYTNSIEVSLPIRFSGRLYYRIQTNGNFQLFEQDTSYADNGRTSGMLAIVQSPLPDLIVEDFNISSTAFSADSVDFNFTIKNVGKLKTYRNEQGYSRIYANFAPTWSDQIVLSKNSFYDPEDRDNRVLFRKYRKMGEELDADSSYTTIGKVKFDRCDFGTNYVFVVTNSGQYTFELSYSNNLSEVDSINIILEPNPDLIPKSLNIDETPKSGETLEVIWTIKNDGFDTVKSNYTNQLYIHKTLPFEANNALSIHRKWKGGVVPQNTEYQDTILAFIPYDVQGNYYFTLVTDATDNICEYPNENNNVLTNALPIEIKLSPQPDLVPSIVYVADTLIAGKPANFILKTENKGQGDAKQGSWSNDLSLLNLQTNETTRLRRYTQYPILASGKEISDTFNLNIPENLDTGQYALVFVNDVKDQLVEFGFENNNEVKKEPIFIDKKLSDFPDITIVSLKVPNQMRGGDKITLTYELENLSAATLPAVWINEISLFDNNQKLIKNTTSKHFGRLLKNEKKIFETTFVLPYDFSGDAVLQFFTNYNNEMYEVVTVNNKKDLSVNILPYIEPDLEPVSITSTMGCCNKYALEEDTIQVIIKNNGDGDVKLPFINRLYLSQDQILDKRDLVISTLRTQKTILKNSIDTLYFYVKYPTYINGDFYYIVHLDQKDTIFEGTNEDNNIMAASYDIRVSNSPTNLKLENINVSNYSGNNDNFLKMEYRASKPIDDVIDRKWTNTIILSTTPNMNSEYRLLLGEKWQTTLNQSTSDFTSDFNFVIPQNLKPGKYYIGLFLDAKNELLETNENDNILFTSQAFDFDFSKLITLDSLHNDQFTEMASNQTAYFRLQRGRGIGMKVSLDVSEKRSSTELFHKSGSIPSSLDYDNKYNTPFLADQQFLVATTQQDTVDYLLAVAKYTPPIFDPFFDPRNRRIDPVPYTLLCESKTYGIEEIYPTQGSLQGTTTVNIQGFDFDKNTKILLLKGGDTIIPQKIFFINTSEINVVLDCREAMAGKYDVIAIKNSQISSLKNAFEVLTEGVEDPFVLMNVTPISLINQKASLNLNFGNYGITDGMDYVLILAMAGVKNGTDALSTQYIGSSEERVLEEIIQKYQISNPNPTGDSMFIDLKGIRYFVYWLPKLASKTQTTFTYQISSAEDDDVFLYSVLYRMQASEYTFSANQDDIGFSATMLEMDEIMGRISGKQKKGGFDCNNIDMKKVHKEIIEETWKVGESVNGHYKTFSGARNMKEAFKKGAESYKEKVKSEFDVKGKLESEAKDGLKDKFLREKTTMEVVNDRLQNFKDFLNPSKKIENLTKPSDPPFKDLLNNVFSCIDFDDLEKEGSKCLVKTRNPEGKTVYTKICNPDKDPKNEDNKFTKFVRSFDPNEIIGPDGSTPARFIQKTEHLQYTIYFENVETATAPAIKVIIDNPLDTNFRLQDFAITELGFGDTVFYFDQPQRISTTIPLGEKYNNYGLRLVAGLNIPSQKAFWEMTTINLNTGNPVTDPFGGFLPPNDSTGRGQGYVKYQIKTKENAPNGYVLKNQAAIIFDQNEVIATNVWENIVSDGKPISFVNALPTVSKERFTVSWSGDDGEDGPGIKGYDIYVSTNNGPYQSWIYNSRDTSAAFIGDFGKTYKFYSILKLLDNTEETKDAIAEATTKVNDTTSKVVTLIRGNSTLLVYPNPGNQILNLRLDQISAQGLSVFIYNQQGQMIYTDKSMLQNCAIYAQTWPQGVYFIKVISGDAQFFVKWMKIND